GHRIHPYHLLDTGLLKQNASQPRFLLALAILLDFSSTLWYNRSYKSIECWAGNWNARPGVPIRKGTRPQRGVVGQKMNAYHHGHTIKAYRKRKGWTQAQLAAAWPRGNGEE